MLHHFFQNRFYRFLLVGGLNTLFGYGVFSFLFLFLHESLALLGSTILGTIFNFKSTGTLVFHSRDNRLFWRFILCYALVYLINLSCLELAHLVEINLYAAQALLLLPMAVVAYFLQKSFVFSRQKP